MHLELPYPAKPLWPNFRSRTHWAKTRAVKVARRYAWGVTKEACIGFVAGEIPIRLLVTVNPPTANAPDKDNAQAACKAYFDGIADALNVNDRFFDPITTIGENGQGRLRRGGVRMTGLDPKFTRMMRKHFGLGREIIPDILARVSRETGVPVSALCGPSRVANTVAARWRAYAALKREGYGYNQIGRALNRDHSTVAHGIRKVMGL